MKQFARDNLVLIVGIALPLLLALVFFLAVKIPAYGIAPPRTAVVYVTNCGNCSENPWRFDVRGGKLYVSYTQPKEHAAPAEPPVLHLYDPRSGSDRTLSLPIYWKAAVAETPVTDLDGIRLDASSISPDGFTFERDHDNDHENAMTVIFGGDMNNDGNHYVLRKNGYSKLVPETEYYYTQFIGWVVP